MLQPSAESPNPAAGSTAPVVSEVESRAVGRFLRSMMPILVLMLLVNQVTPPPDKSGGFSLSRVGLATDQPGP